MDLNECIDVLRKAKIMAVIARWDSSDSGDTDFQEEMEYFDSNNKDVSDSLDDRFTSVKLEDTDTYELEEELGTRFHDIMDRIDSDLNGDLGSSGSCRLDVAAGRVTVEINRFVRASQKTEHTVSFSNERDIPTTKILEEAKVVPQAAEKDEYEKDEEPEVEQGPTCTCTSLLRGHDANCPYWQHQQKTGSAR